MRNYLMAAVAAAAFATPALARDHSPYVGIEGGGMILEDVVYNARGTTLSAPAFLRLDHRVGYDVDAIAGYDFGPVRLEGELGYKRAKVKGVVLGLTLPAGSGHSSARSAMANLLLDFGSDTGASGYIGGGAGVASTRTQSSTTVPLASFSTRDSGFAYQAIAGVRFPVGTNIDLGLKYRFFNTLIRDNRSGYAPLFAGGPAAISSRFRSHSLLASLIFNFAAPVVAAPVIEAAPPPPPPPPPPATQTCPDGSVILATDVCPAPPPPPPPPPPAPERG